MLEELFSVFGLSAREVQVANCLVGRGQQRASHISKLSEMPRNTVRGILDKLVVLGLAVKTRSKNTQYYSLERQESLLLSLEQKRDSFNSELDNQIDMVQRLGSALDDKTQPNRPRITFYDGTAGLRKVYEDTLSATNGLRSWASFDANKQALPRYFETYYRRRVKRGVTMKSIHPDTQLARQMTRQNKQFLRKSVLVPANKYNWTPEIQIYDDKINIVSWKDKLGIIIESAELAQALTAIFDLSYESAQKCYGQRS